MEEKKFSRKSEKWIRDLDWNDLYQMTNIDLANTYFQEKVSAILNQVAPVIVVQPQRKVKPWVTDTTKDEMKTRDCTCKNHPGHRTLEEL